MKILQVVTYISPDGAYGGPVRVAINQAKALTELGHEVVIAAAAGGIDGPLPDEYDGFPVRLFPSLRLVPKSGFAGLTSPGLLKWLVKVIRGADVIHVHMARDLVSLPSAAIAALSRKPLVVQTHGMIDRTDKKLAAPLDRFLTRPILRSARQVLYLTARERQDLTSVARGELASVHLPNGVPLPQSLATEQSQGPERVSEVLYLARLHPRKRPMVFVRAAGALSPTFPNIRFTLVGPDEGEGDTVRTALQSEDGLGSITWSGPMPPEMTLPRMRQAAVYVLPSTDEPFPMSVLEAMPLGLPVIITDSCGLAPMVRRHNAGIVCRENPEDFELALGQLLGNVQMRLSMGANARRLVAADYSMASVAKRLTAIYGTSIDGGRTYSDD